jgi:hypothetical protein
MNSSYTSQRSERGFVVPVVIGLVVLLLAGILTPYFVFGKVVPPDQIGVRRNFFSVPGLLAGGFSSHGLPPGLHWQFPLVSEVGLIPRGVQYVTFSKSRVPGEQTIKELLVPTTDGSKVETDVTLVLRFFEQAGGAEQLRTLSNDKLKTGTSLEAAPKPERKNVEHGGPRELIERYGSDTLKILERVAERSENELKQNLSQLSTSDYYNPILREQSALRAQENLATGLGLDGIELWGTLIRRYSYAERKIDDQIFAKNLQDQTERLNAAASKLAAAKAETEKQRAFWDAKIQSLEVEGQSKADVIKSQAELFESSKHAQGDLLVAESRAEVDTRRAKALSEIQGADVYIARELAPILRSLKGGVVSDVDPYNIDAWIKKLVGEKQQ